MRRVEKKRPLSQNERVQEWAVRNSINQAKTNLNVYFMILYNDPVVVGR